MNSLELETLPKNYTNGHDAYRFYEDIPLDILTSTIKKVLALGEKGGHEFGYIEVPLLRAYERAVWNQRENFDNELILKCCEVFQLDQIQYVYENLCENFDKCRELSLAMGEVKYRLWSILPSVTNSEEKIKDFYSGIQIPKLVIFMQAVIDEWNMDYSDPIKDESVRSVELPLIIAFRNKATADDIKKHMELLEDFKICDDENAVNIARAMLGQKPLDLFMMAKS